MIIKHLQTSKLITKHSACKIRKVLNKILKFKRNTSVPKVTIITYWTEYSAGLCSLNKWSEGLGLASYVQIVTPCFCDSMKSPFNPI